MKFKILSLIAVITLIILCGIAIYLEARSLEFIDATVNLVLQNHTLPRIGVSLLCGAFLGIASIILQQITHNPLASDSTLGVSAGASFFLVALMVFFPALVQSFGIWFAFLGAIFSLGLLICLSYGKSFSIFTTTLSGLIIGLFFGAFTSCLLVFFPEESFFITAWLSGYLTQNNPYDFFFMLLLGIPALVLIFYYSSSFEVFLLGDSGARSVGVNVTLLRIIGLVIAAYLVGMVVSFVGVISFVGLAACTLANKYKTNNFFYKVVVCAFIGAMLLGITDVSLQIIFLLTQINFPAGSITALLGAPLLLWLTFTTKGGEVVVEKDSATAPIKSNSKSLLMILLVVLVAFCFISLFIGHFGFTWDLEILDVRYKRVLVALASGICLGLIGVILQRLSQNSMASPELLGINSGVTLGVLFALFFAPQLNVVFGIIGACVMLAFMIVLNFKNGMVAQKVILTGIAIMALVTCIEKILLVAGDSRIYGFLTYVSGSTYSVTAFWSIVLFIVSLFACGFALLFSREIGILSLGAVSASSVGLSVVQYRIILLLFSAVISAIVALSIGPVSFIGLLAPHIATFFGLYRPHLQLLGSMMIGGIIMVFSDFVGRTLIFPYEIPSGLIATMIGSAYFVFMIRRF